MACLLHELTTRRGARTSKRKSLHVIASAPFSWSSLSFSPNGNKITVGRRLTETTLGDIYTMNVDGTHLKDITNTMWHESAPDWGPRTSHWAAVVDSVPSEVWVPLAAVVSAMPALSSSIDQRDKLLGTLGSRLGPRNSPRHVSSLTARVSVRNNYPRRDDHGEHKLEGSGRSEVR
jgi:hypothetical protein